MDKSKTLTWGDADAYFHACMPGQTPKLPPERLALLEADLADRQTSLVIDYMILRCRQLTRATERFNALSEDDAMRHIDRVYDKLSNTHPDAGKDFGMPLTEKIEQLRRQLGVHGSLRQGPAEGDKRENPGYDRGGSGRGRG